MKPPTQGMWVARKRDPHQLTAAGFKLGSPFG